MTISRRSMLTLAAGAALAGVIPGASAQAQERSFEQSFRSITPQPAPTDKIEVIDFFWYGCPYCFQLMPMFAEWEKTKAADVVVRRIQLQVPSGLALDTASLPRPGKRGGALELRSVAWRQAAQELVVEYQVLLSPPTPRVLEMPAFELRFAGAGGQPAGSLRIDAWPVAVSPLVAAEIGRAHV